MLITINDADHLGDICSDLEGRWENMRDDIVTPTKPEETADMRDAAAAIEWLEHLAEDGPYPLTLDLANLPEGVTRQIAITLENLADQ